MSVNVQNITKAHTSPTIVNDFVCDGKVNIVFWSDKYCVLNITVITVSFANCNGFNVLCVIILILKLQLLHYSCAPLYCLFLKKVDGFWIKKLFFLTISCNR